MPVNREFREQLGAALLARRPNLSRGSLTTYVSILSNLPLKIEGGEETLAWYSSDPASKIAYIRDHIKSEQTQKSSLSALFVLTEIPAYREPMMEIAQAVSDQYTQQTRTTKQQSNQLPFSAIEARYTQACADAERSPSMENLQAAVMLALMSGAGGVIPRRLEWCLCRTKAPYNPATENFLNATKGVATFNVYKTSRQYGVQTVNLKGEVDPQNPQLGRVPDSTLALVRKWLRLNTSGWLFVNPKTGSPMSNADLSKYIARVVGKGIGVDNLRSAYINHLYGGIPALATMEARAVAMGHTVESAMKYYAKQPDTGSG